MQPTQWQGSYKPTPQNPYASQQGYTISNQQQQQYANNFAQQHQAQNSSPYASQPYGSVNTYNSSFPSQGARYQQPTPTPTLTYTSFTAQQSAPAPQSSRYAPPSNTYVNQSTAQQNPYAPSTNVASYFAAPQQPSPYSNYTPSAPTRVPNLPPPKKPLPSRKPFYDDKRGIKRKRSPKRVPQITAVTHTNSKPRDEIEASPSPSKFEKSFISVHSIVSIERQIVDLKSRYPNLYISHDFVKSKSHWVNALSNSATEIPAQHSVRIECDNETGLITAGINAAPAELYQGIKFNAKVVIPLGCGDVLDESAHLTTQFKFLVAKKDRSGLSCIGTAWSPVDGSDPLNDEAVLVKTAIRGVKEFCDLDLSNCKSWVKVIELEYFRPAESIHGKQFPEMEERTIIFMPFLSDAKPSAEQFQRIWKEKQELLSKINSKALESEMPKEPFLYATTQHEKLKNNMKCMAISLDGLLDYNLDDKLEKTFELSLFAEAFHEILQRKYAYELYSYFKANKLPGDAEDKEPLQKKQKTEHDADVLELNLHPKEITLDRAPSPVSLPASIIEALRYFDRQGQGFVKTLDIENAIHSLCLGISRAQMFSLLPSEERIMYAKSVVKE